MIANFTCLTPAPDKAIYMVLLAVLCLFFTPRKSSAADSTQSREIPAVWTQTPPIIDGNLNDQCWTLANVTSDFTEHKTERKAIEQTFIRVLYDDVNIYIAFECLEPEPNRILATQRKYDRGPWEDDWVEVQIDTFHDHRCNYSFAINTLGTRYDERSGPFGGDRNWDCDWTAACSITYDRWFAEMAIPISAMHYAAETNAVWGINFHRDENGRQENSSWSYPADRPFSPREFGMLTGLDLDKIEHQYKPQFETYVSHTGTLSGAGTGKIGVESNRFTTGLDISQRLSSQWISALTLNPDFGQVEADPDTIELRDTERFLQERRPFFQEGAELFNTPLNLYYSRRFLDIDAGAKFTGQGKKWTAAILDIEGKVSRDDKLTRGNFLVARAVRNFNHDAQLGGFFSNSERKDGSNRVGGIDSQIYLDEDNWITTQFLTLSDSKGVDTDGQIDHTAHAMWLDYDGGRKPWRYGMAYRHITRGFVPDLGYIPRRDIRGPSAWLNYYEDIEDGPVKWVNAWTDAAYFDNRDSQTALRDFDNGAAFCLRNELAFEFSRGDYYHKPYYNSYNHYELDYNRVDRWNSFEISFTDGIYEGVPYTEWAFEKPLKLTDRLTTEFELDYRVERQSSGNQTIWLWRLVTESGSPSKTPPKDTTTSPFSSSGPSRRISTTTSPSTTIPRKTCSNAASSIRLCTGSDALSTALASYLTARHPHPPANTQRHFRSL